jgi:hypothetical protein
MTSQPEKVVGLFGGEVTPPGKTSDKILEKYERFREVLAERKMVSFAAVSVDEDGLCHVVFARDAMKSTSLIGGLSYAQFKCAQDLDEDMHDVTPGMPKDQV